MKKVIRILIPVILALAIMLCMAWYLFIYDQEFTRDMLLQSARYCESKGNHNVAAWFYDLAYKQASDNDSVAIELAQQHKASGNYTQAEYTLVNAIADGGGTELYIELCKTYVEQDKLMDAVKLLDAVCQENSTVDTQVRQELDQLRPAAPTASPDPGFYSQYISVSIECGSGTLYVNPNGQYPSIEDEPYSHTITLADGENTIYAVAVADNGLVSPLSIFGYTVGGVIEEVSFSDAAMEAAIRNILAVTEDKVLFTNDLWTITSFTVPADVQSLADLKYMIFLEELTINAGVSGQLNNLSSLANLTSLTITDTTVLSEELSIIGGLPKLEKLTLNNCGLSTTSGLENAKNITYLDLSENTIRNIDALSSMQILQQMYLQHNALTDLSAVSGIQTLVAVDVSYNSLTSVSPICGISSITWLDASHNTLTDLSKINQLTALNYLSVAHNTLTDISGLGSCAQLTELNISNNAITDISALAGLNSLTKLDFSYNQATELPSWQTSCALVTIDGSHNLLSSLEPLRGLDSLNNVYMDYNENIESVACLADCHLLIQVNVYGTKVTDVKALTDMSVIVNYDPTQES